jgi:hypothetical protein
VAENKLLFPKKSKLFREPKLCNGINVCVSQIQTLTLIPNMLVLRNFFWWEVVVELSTLTKVSPEISFSNHAGTMILDFQLPGC